MKKKRSAPPAPKPAPASRDWKPFQAAAGLCVLAFAAFANSFTAGFPLDNKPLILEDPRVHEATSEHIAQIFQHSYWWPRGESGLYRPLTTLSYLFNYSVLGDGASPAGYHLVNLLLHLLNVLLFYAVARRLIRSFWPATFAAALWAVHPVLTESVTNIVGRADLLASAAILGGLLLYWKAVDSAGGQRVAWAVALAGVTLAGLFSKESAVAIAGAIAIFELAWWRERRQTAGLAMAAGTLALPFLIMLSRREIVLSATRTAFIPFTDNPIAWAGFWTGRLTAMKVLSHYLWLSIWPAHLSADYSYNSIPLSTGSAADWAAWIAAAAAIAGCVALWRWNRTAFFFCAFAFVTLFPTANLAMPIGTIMAERFLYLPLAGLMAVLAMGAYWMAERLGRAQAAAIVLSVIVLAFAGRTWARNTDWTDDLTLAQATVRTSPTSFKAHAMLAEAWYFADNDHQDVDRVLAEARQAIAILDPLPPVESNPQIYRLAGACDLLKGDRLRDKGAATPASMVCYREALPLLQRGAKILEAARARQGENKLEPSIDDDVYRLLSVAYLRLGNGDGAFDAGLEARKREPLNPEVYSQIGDVYHAAGEMEHAADALTEGMLVTSDMGLRQKLIDLYREGWEGTACAVVSGPNGPAINPGCALVRRNLCDASVDAVKISAAADRLNTARSLKQSMLRDYGCPAGPLNAALPE
jgi:hypothetical protein